MKLTKNSKIFLAGHNGMVGSAIKRKLIEKGYKNILTKPRKELDLTNQNQTFNIFTGVGSNGKSVLVKLLSMVLGDYKGTVPISLITQKRLGLGGTSSEVAQLKGLRFAVMNEPSKGDEINEGIMKELTGGDPIQARELYKSSITFIPMFKMACCTNTVITFLV